MLFFKPQVRFPLNIATPIIIYNSPEIFYLKQYSFVHKEPINVQFIRLLGALMNIHPCQISHPIFETLRPGLIQILHHCSVS